MSSITYTHEICFENEYFTVKGNYNGVGYPTEILSIRNEAGENALEILWRNDIEQITKKFDDECYFDLNPSEK